MGGHKAVLVAKNNNCWNEPMELSRQAFLNYFDELVEENYGRVDVGFVRMCLERGEALFIEEMGQLGDTQESVLKTLVALVRDSGLRVFVVDVSKTTVEVDVNTVGILEAFRCLDVVLMANAA